MTSSGDDSAGRAESAEEVARLKAELARLKAEKGEQAVEQTGGRRGWWRPVVATLLIIIAALLAPVSVLATWSRDQVGDTDRYLETVAPLASDPDVQDAIARRVEDVIFSYLNIDDVTRQLVQALSSRDLPPAVAATLTAAAGPLASGIENFVSERIRAFVESDTFEQAWIEANRTAHEQLVAVLTGEGSDTIDISRGEVTIQLATLINAVKGELVERGFGIAERIPEVQATFTIVRSDDLAKVQGGFDLLNSLATWIPVVGLLLLAIAILISRDRRRTTMAAGLAVAGGMILLGLALNVIRPFYLDALPAEASTAAAGAIYDQVVSFIRTALRAVLVVALALAVGAWLSAKRGSGAAARRGIVRGIDALRGGTSRAGLRTGAFGVALAQYRMPIRVGVIGVAALAYLLQDHPTGGTALTFVIVTAVLLILLEVLATGPAEAAPESQTSESP
jgi:hypothetical protein